MNRLFAIVILIFVSFSFGPGDLQYRTIRNERFKIEFYITTENEHSFKAKKQYFWYKSGEIHSSFGASGGDLLDNDYTKYYKDNELAEKGLFKKGLKDGEWKTWHKNGHIESIVEWRKGIQRGEFLLFDDTGTLLVAGKYIDNKKHGEWIDYRTADTLTYKRGKIRIKDTLKKEFFLKRFWNKNFNKKKIDTIPLNDSETDTLKKESFFKRLFGSKNKKEDEKGKN